MNKKCQACNRPIKHDYSWDGQVLGIDCWKKIALPEIEKQRAARREVLKRRQWEQDYALAAALKRKDFSKIKSQFKLNFLNDLVGQFEEKGFISQRQKQIVYGTGAWNGSFYDNGMLNNKDRLHEAIALYIIGDADSKEMSQNMAMSFSEKEQAIYKQEIAS